MATQYVLWGSVLWGDGLWGPLLWETTGTTSTAGGGSGKRRYIVRKDGRLLVFGSEAHALSALAPEQVVEVKTVRQLAKARGEVPAVKELLAKAEYDGLMALVERMLDEEDEELLMLAA